MKEFRLTVCDDCLAMAGQECHTPGCSFWMHDTPTADLVAVLVESTA